VSSNLLIGAVLPLTGNEASFGQSVKKGLELAIEHINQSGVLKNKKIELKIYDDQGKTEEATLAITRLIQKDKVIAVIGEVASSRSLAMAPIAQKNKIPMISPTATNAKLTTLGDFIFRACFIDSFQGTVMAIFAADNLRMFKAAILRDVSSDYANGLADEFKNSFQKLGGEIIKDESYQSGDVHFKAQLTQIKAKNPDILFIPGYYTETGLILKQARELGISSVMLGGDGWESQKLIDVAGKAANQSYFTSHSTTAIDTPDVRQFVINYKKKYNQDIPDGIATIAYDTAFVLADAIERAHEPTALAIKEALANTKNVRGLSGRISLNKDRNATKPAYIIKIENNKFEYATTINPYPFP